jgi:hypothetical protein
MRHWVIHLNYKITTHDDADIDARAEALQVALAQLGIVVELEDISEEEDDFDCDNERFHSGTGESIDDESYEQYLNGPSNPL